MTNPEFIDHIADFFRLCIQEMHRKNPDYAHQGVPLHDMFHQAFLEGIKPEQVLRVLMRKHWTAIQAWASGHSLTSETLDNRLHDAANYVGMLAMLSREHGPDLIDSLIDHVAEQMHFPNCGVQEDIDFYKWLCDFRACAFNYHDARHDSIGHHPV